MSKLQDKVILIINDSPLQVRDLKKYLENEKNAKVFNADDIREAMKIIAKEEIELVLAEFTIPRNYKFKLIRHAKNLGKDIPKYLIINTRVIIQKKKKKEKEQLTVVGKADLEKTSEFNLKRLENHYDISQNFDELREKPLELKIKSLDKEIDADFLEIVEDGLICSVNEKLILNQECEFAVKNFLNQEGVFEMTATVKEVTKDDEEDFYIVFVKISDYEEDNWKKIIEDLEKKQEEADNFLKAANE
jgi:CheY-like chemotaxis protein